MGAKGNQVVIYSMTLEAEEDLAMVLPIPITETRDEESVQFIDLSEVPHLFPHLDRGFDYPTFGAAPEAAVGASRSKLAVKEVGSYEASFVPKVDDFDRLDPRFRIPKEIWKGLPEYLDHGFTVFKLKAGRSKVHPMGFAYPARDRTKIVFPTVHIHDGKVHKKAAFDHALYCQTQNKGVKMDWLESMAMPGTYIDLNATHGAIRPNLHVYKRQMVGQFVNEDVTISAL